MVKIDDFDFEILTYLQKDGRMSLSDIADKMNVSVNTIRNRVTDLIEAKVLSIIGRVDIEKIGFEFYVQVRIKVRPTKKVNVVAKKLSELEETSFVALCSGNFDIEINLMCVNKKHLIDTMQKIHDIDGIEESLTNDYFKIYKISQPNLDLIKKHS